ALGMEGSERWLVEPLELDAAVLGDVVLQQLQEAELLRREAQVLVDERRERLLNSRGIESDQATEHGEERSARLRVVPRQVLHVGLVVDLEDEARQLFELVVAHTLAGPNALQGRVLREVFAQHRLDTPLVLDEV